MPLARRNKEPSYNVSLTIYHSLKSIMNRFESGHKEEFSKETATKVFFRMETDLLHRAGCTRKDNEKCEKWIAQHAKNLRDFVNAHPEVLDAWEANPDGTARYIEKEIGAPEGHSH